MTANDINDPQKAFWSDGPGQHWVRLYRELDTLHSNVANHLIDAASPQPGQRILDIGCGAGETTLRLAAQIKPAGHIVGLDISEPLIKLARERAEQENSSAQFIIGDAQFWQSDGEPFDLVVSRFGLMFFADPVAAFANILTSLRPGGELIFTAWNSADQNPWFHTPMQIAVEQLGPAAPSDPDAPGPTAFRNTDRVCELLAMAGAEAPTAKTVETTLSVPQGASAAADLTRFVGPVSRHIAEKGGDDADMEAIHAVVLEKLMQYDGPEGCEIPASVHLYRAKKPA